MSWINLYMILTIATTKSFRILFGFRFIVSLWDVLIKQDELILCLFNPIFPFGAFNAAWLPPVWSSHHTKHRAANSVSSVKQQSAASRPVEADFSDFSPYRWHAAAEPNESEWSVLPRLSQSRNSWVPGRVATGQCWVSKHVAIVSGFLWKRKKSRKSVYC